MRGLALYIVGFGITASLASEMAEQGIFRDSLDAAMRSISSIRNQNPIHSKINSEESDKSEDSVNSMIDDSKLVNSNKTKLNIPSTEITTNQNNQVQNSKINSSLFLNSIQNSSIPKLNQLNPKDTKPLINSQNNTVLPTANYAEQVVMNSNGHDRAGGDFIAIEFLTYAQAFNRDLKRLHNKALFTEVSETNIIMAMSEFRINPVYDVIYDSLGIQRDAITDFSQKEIQIYAPSWFLQVSNRKFKASIVIHELLRAAGYSREDDLHSLSQRIINYLINDPNGSFILSVSNSKVDSSRFFISNKTKLIRCNFKGSESTNSQNTLNSFGKASDSNLSVTIFITPYGVRYEAIDKDNQSANFIYSDYLQNIEQFSYGEKISMAVLRDSIQNPGKRIILTLESVISMQISNQSNAAMTIQTPHHNDVKYSGFCGKSL